MHKLLAEYRYFHSCPYDMRILLAANMIWALIAPVVNVFVAAYVLWRSDDVAMVIAYQMALFIASPLMFLVNGLLLRRLQVKTLYSAGMLLYGAAMAALMTMETLDFARIALVGALMGTATGIYWANRCFLALASTTDDNRNYFYGMENAFLTVGAVLVPLIAGWLIEATAASPWLGGDRRLGYRMLAAAVVLLAIAAAAIIHAGRFSNPPLSRLLYFRFHSLWYRFQALAVLRGMVQGYLLTAPAMLIMHVARGAEGTLGTAQAAGGVVAAAAFYTIGRRAAPRHRLLILASGVTLFATGALVNAALFSPPGVWIFMLCLLAASPLLDMAYFPIHMQVIDALVAIDRRNPYAYILNHEFGLLAGRVAGCGLFLVLAQCASRDFALRYALLAVGMLQLLSIGVARAVCRHCPVEPRPGGPAPRQEVEAVA